MAGQGGKSAAPRRVGVIDVGSNSVRLVVFEGETRSPAYFFNEKVLCGLGADLARTGRLAPEGRRRALAAIRRFVALAGRIGVRALDGVATAAVRDASDGLDFVEEVKKATGFALRVASGEDEARLSAQGVLLGWPGAEGLVADLGGASLELARVGGGKVRDGRTLQLGPLRLMRDGRSLRNIDALIDEELRDAVDLFAEPPKRLFLVGGAWRALGKIHMTRTHYPLEVLHEYELPAAEMRAAADWVAHHSPKMLARTVPASPERLQVTPTGARVLTRLIDAARPERVALSAFGLREGIYYEHLPPRIRAQDPLLSACAMLEKAQARFPGFGEELFGWLTPLVANEPEERLRLVRAACLLNDVSWNSHPDFREQACFETVYRANISGVSHAERALIGAVLLYRYKSSRKKRSIPGAVGILDEGDQARARMIGRAIRLGAMVSGSAPGALAHCALRIESETVTLRLGADAAVLAGEVVERRLAALADSLGVRAVIEV